MSSGGMPLQRRLFHAQHISLTLASDNTGSMRSHATDSNLTMLCLVDVLGIDGEEGVWEPSSLGGI